MDEGVQSLGISKTELLPIHKNTSLEQRIYSEKDIEFSEKYTELNDFLQGIDPKVATSQSLEKKIRKYFRVGLIAKNGFEKASKIYNENSEPFDESHYLLEKGQTPTLLHRYAKRLKVFNKIIVKDKIRDFERAIVNVAYKYKSQLRKFGHNKSLYHVLDDCGIKEVKTKKDVIEALMLAHDIGVTDVIIPYWDKNKVDNKKVCGFIKNLFESKKNIKLAQVLDIVSRKFGREMSKSTLYSYLKENKETIKLPIKPNVQETDIPNIQSNVG